MKLRLVLVRDGETHAAPNPVSREPPTLTRFIQQSLLWSDAMAVGEGCSLAYARNALEVRTGRSEAHGIFYLGVPVIGSPR